MERKLDHLKLFCGREVGARAQTTWLEHVRLVHNALPELDVEQIDLTARFAGHTFAAPLFITGMTGGFAAAGEVNRALARVAERLGVGFGLGSQRAMLEDPRLAGTYDVRGAAPRAFVAGNIGGVQAARTPVRKIRSLVDRVGANALCVHLNPAQELAQPEGDRDFRGVLAAIGELVSALDVPVIVKETGAGLGREAAVALRAAGVRYMDIAGAGGTSWIGVELERRGGAADGLACLWDFGIPTAAAVMELGDLDVELIASGGVRTGLDAARALALGARLAGLAAPLLRAYFSGGLEGCERAVRDILAGLRAAMALAGARDLSGLRKAPRVITGELGQWAAQRSGAGRAT